MSHRTSKTLRRALKQQGIDPKEKVYETNKVQVKDKYNNLSVMEAVTLKEGCGRKLYKDSKIAFSNF